MTIDISIYEPGRFSYLMNEPFTQELWNFISDDTQIEKMTLATKQGLPAIEFILSELEDRFNVYLESKEYPEEDVGIFANNMIKQVMQHNGYVYTACGLCPDGKYIKMSGVYTTDNAAD